MAGAGPGRKGRDRPPGGSGPSLCAPGLRAHQGSKENQGGAPAAGDRRRGAECLPETVQCLFLALSSGVAVAALRRRPLVGRGEYPAGGRLPYGATARGRGMPLVGDADKEFLSLRGNPGEQDRRSLLARGAGSAGRAGGFPPPGKFFEASSWSLWRAARARHLSQRSQGCQYPGLFRQRRRR